MQFIEIMREFFCLISVFSVFFGSVYGSLTDRYDVRLNRIPSSYVYRIYPVYTPHKPTIDGYLDDSCWEMAKRTPSAIADGFVYRDLGEFPALEPTIVYTAYDDKFIYFAFECYKEDVDEIVADLLVRDSSLWYDDHIQVIIDTNCDRSSAYYFGVTPENVQMDGYVAKDGELENENWDCVWYSATQINDEGWVAEIAIPFRALMFEMKEEKEWGINFFRLDRKQGDQTIWRDTGGDLYNVSRYGTMILKRNIDRSPTLDIQPYASGEIDWKTEEERGRELGVGVDFQSRIIPTMTFSGTVNPDFAQIEADPDEINLDPSKELYYPEKRPFFLNGQEHFDTPIQLFYSRRIGKIKWGGKFTGWMGGLSYYVMDVRANEARLMKRTDAPYYNFAVLRTAYDIRHDMALGFTGVDRRRKNERTTVMGVDTKYSAGDIATFDFQVAVMDKPEFENRLTSFSLSAYRYSSDLSFYTGYEDIADRFGECETGYIPYDDIRGLWNWVEYDFWPYAKGMEMIYLYGYGDYYKDHKGRDAMWYQEGQVGVRFLNGIELVYDFSRNMRVWESGLYRETLKNHYHEFFCGYNMLEWSSTYFDYIFGKNYWWDMNYINVASSFKVTSRLAIELGVEYERLKKRKEYYYGFENELERYKPVENIWIFIVKWNYQITHDLFMRTFLQSSGLDNTWTVNALIGYNYYKGSHIYLAYNEWREYSAPGKPLLGRILFLKGDFNIGL